MEGACGKLTESCGIVKKTIKKKYTGLSAKIQFNLQTAAYELCKRNAFQVIRVPRTYKQYDNSYTMDKIDDSIPYYAADSQHNMEFIRELDVYYIEFITLGYLPNDIECYLQPDGTVYIIDYDKYIKLPSVQNTYMAHFIPEHIRLKYMNQKH
jgi:hypothetical protein